ncbi:predicted protein [Botrytis cinerea T4]|uniref:Uncharacterized protein n=1 Tax=Botryotinia fuckeliana (strain T4) TaxID=999810 RepID=G2YNI8_BOTF4|nr:predicted protein [Botrytis cinerea T4]
MITSIQRKKTALTIFKLRTLIYGTAVYRSISGVPFFLPPKFKSKDA